MTSLGRQGSRGVLVIHPGALGDVLLARPSLLALRNQFPESEIALLAGESIGVLLREGGEVDRVLPLESTYLSELFAGLGTLRPAFKAWLSNCDVAVGWLQDREGAICHTLRASGLQWVCLQSTSSSELLAEHQAARYLEIVKGAAISEIPTTPLALPPHLREQGTQTLQGLNWTGRQPLVVIHPGSGSARKCLDAPRLARVSEWLSQAGMTPMLLEGPADCEAVANVLANLSVAVPVIRGLDLPTVAGVMAQAALYIGHDSGMTHLAAALSIPTIACFGPTDSRRWAPLGPTVSIQSGAPCICTSWRDVEECRERVCLQIAPERIIEICRTILAR